MNPSRKLIPEKRASAEKHFLYQNLCHWHIFSTLNQFCTVIVYEVSLSAKNTKILR